MKELMVLGFIVTSCSQGHTAQEDIAFRTAARAFYKQSTVEDKVNQLVKKEVPKEFQLVAGNTIWIAKALTERKITVTWSY